MAGKRAKICQDQSPNRIYSRGAIYKRGLREDCEGSLGRELPYQFDNEDAHAKEIKNGYRRYIEKR